MKQYDKKYITKILLILQKNNFDIGRTVRENNVNKQTLHRWKKQYGEEVWKDPDHVETKADVRTINKAATSNNVIIQDSEKFETVSQIRNKSEDVVLKILTAIEKKLDADIEDGKISLSQLTNTLDKTIPYILAKFDNKGMGGGPTMENTYNVLIKKMYTKIGGSHEG
jgi:transposase-like protein